MAKPTCSVEDCDRPVVCRTFCKTHYSRWYRHGDPTVSKPRGGSVLNDLKTAGELLTGARECKTCGLSKPLEEYGQSARYRGGRLPNCPPCHSRLEAERYKRRRDLDTERRASGRWRDLYLRRTYGITSAQFDAIAAGQGNACAVCRRQTDLVVDHCHASGNVRALLCNDCNLALGHVRDDPYILRSLISYLERFVVDDDIDEGDPDSYTPTED